MSQPLAQGLLYSRSLILEHVKWTAIAPIRTVTEDGDIKPAVALSRSPQSSSHEGNGVLVTVLIPNDAA
ncbi:hypothetical protein N657DRAFT_648869 [Parathielavia appendiculata]|uniref:Uncharacterized protein n=1 Tax=Parathielavia appendiculata TaxID=2587402 RepID=A0AAN6Z1L8_9PEZI|nr:hypothetical protein N657DRAFT_648869 [Parathielavia appendiculata]